MLTYGMSASVDISADDYELAEVALIATTSESAAIIMLRDECGWTLGKAKCVIDLIRISQR